MPSALPDRRKLVSRRASDEYIQGTLTEKIAQLERRVDELSREVQYARDTRNRGLGVLLFLGATAPTLGAIMWYLLQKAFRGTFTI